jgi:hypothetical protein
MFSFRDTPNLGVHLIGAGPFKTDVRHNWFVRSGWTVSGDGMDVTKVQLTGNVAGIHYQLNCFSSDPNIATDNVTITNLTCDANWAELSTTADTGANGEKNIKTAAVLLYGSNNLVDHVRSTNTYGSWANAQEHFAICQSAPRNHDGTNDTIQFCRADSPFGNYGNPFSLSGWVNTLPATVLQNSKVIQSTAVGNQDGANDGFTSGGVNAANLQNCTIDSNTFTDCEAAYHQDTGSCDGVQITNNTVVRGWYGVALLNSVAPKQNITISGNNLNIQNRLVGGAGYGVVATYAETANLTITNNIITQDLSGTGLQQIYGLSTLLLQNATITGNTITPRYNRTSGSNMTISNNLQPDGQPVPGL